MSHDEELSPKLKPLPADAIAAALEKAKRYRLLNEAHEAESICRDILRVEPDNQDALITMLLALSDQFDRRLARRYKLATHLIPRLDAEYDRAYYSGILCERRAKAQHMRHTPSSGQTTYHWLREAMEWYEKAHELRHPGEDDPTLRWNSCVRMMRSHPDIKPAAPEREEVHLLE